MKEKFLLTKEYILKFYNFSPFLFGLLCGYFGEPIIKFLLGLTHFIIG